MDTFLILLFTIALLNLVKTAPTFSFLNTLEESPQKPDINSMIPLFKMMQKPKSNEKNPVKLMYMLGESYDPEYTSITIPISFRAQEPTLTMEAESLEKETDIATMKTNPKVTEEVENVKFIVKRYGGKKKEYGNRLTKKLQYFLWNLSKCPVKYRWIDLGENIFPRYIKRGACAKKKTCSFPSGMKCKESKWKDVDVLLYTCLKEYNSVTKDCKWHPMRLHVLTECSCGCKK